MAPLSNSSPTYRNRAMSSIVLLRRPLSTRYLTPYVREREGERGGRERRERRKRKERENRERRESREKKERSESINY